MRFRILGPVEAWDGQRWRPPATARQRALLLALLLRPNRVLPRDRLVAVLWDGEPPRAAHDVLSAQVGRLRRLLGDAGREVIVTRDGGYQLVVTSGGIDSYVAETLSLEAAERLDGGDPAGAARTFRDALDLWRGRSLEDADGCVPWATAAAERLDEVRRFAAEGWVEAELRLGNHEALLPQIKAMALRFSARERLRAFLMVALYRDGRPEQALAAFEDLRLGLAESGLEPSPQLRALQQRIRDRTLPLVPAHAPPVVRGGREPDRARAHPRTLPRGTVTFTGRDEELRLITAALGGGRSGTCAVHGAGGMGKTTLAVRAAGELAGAYPDGTAYLDLHGTAVTGAWTPRADRVTYRLLRALGVAREDVPPDPDGAAARLRDLLTDRRTLLVLDDVRGADQLRDLLPPPPGTGVLVTSRHALPGLPGATRIPLGPLPDPAATALLAVTGGPDRVAAEADAAAAVVRLCAGRPLALCVAGARLAARPTLPVHVLAGNLVAQRQRCLRGNAWDLPVRTAFLLAYRELRGSADPVDEDAARALRMAGLLDVVDLGVPAAATLLDRSHAATTRALDRLVEARLLQSPLPGRYAVHHVLRGLARDCAQVDEPSALRVHALSRALHWYAMAARRADRLVRVPGPARPAVGAGAEHLPRTAPEAATWLETEWANLLAAARQAQSAHDPVRDLVGPLSQAAAQVRAGWPDTRGRGRDGQGPTERSPWPATRARPSP